VKTRLTILAFIGSLMFVFQNCSDVSFSSVATDVKPLGCGPGLVPDAITGECRPLRERTTTATVVTQARQVDLFFIIDNSGSMAEDNRKLSEKLGGFVALLQNSNIDWQACYTTTDVRTDREQGRALKWLSETGTTTNDVVLSPASSGDIDSRFRRSIGRFTGGGGGNEQGINAMGLALNRTDTAVCFRTGAALTPILISDEDENSCGGRCQNSSDEMTLTGRLLSSYTNQYRELTAANTPEYLINLVKERFAADKKFLFHSLVIKSKPQTDLSCYHTQDIEAQAFYGITYENLSQLTGGISGSICSNDYAIELKAIAERIDETLASITLECAPYNNEVNVVLSPQPVGQTYSVQGDKLIFTPALVAGTSVTASYKCLD